MVTIHAATTPPAQASRLVVKLFPGGCNYTGRAVFQVCCHRDFMRLRKDAAFLLHKNGVPGFEKAVVSTLIHNFEVCSNSLMTTTVEAVFCFMFQPERVQLQLRTDHLHLPRGTVVDGFAKLFPDAEYDVVITPSVE